MLIVETTGQFGLMAPDGSNIWYDRPTVVRSSQFVDFHSSIGRLHILRTNLPETASDVEFAKFWAESQGDKELAVESYVASLMVHEPEPEPEDEPEPEPEDEPEPEPEPEDEPKPKPAHKPSHRKSKAD